MARSSEAGARKSPGTYSSDKSAIARFVLDARRSTRTLSPRATNCRVTWLPRKPPAPVTRVVLRLLCLPHPRLLRVRGASRKHRLPAKSAARRGALAQRAVKRIPTNCFRSVCGLRRFSAAKFELPEARSLIRRGRGKSQIHPHPEIAPIGLILPLRSFRFPERRTRARRSKSPRAWQHGCLPRPDRVRWAEGCSTLGAARQPPDERLEKAATRAEIHECGGAEEFPRSREKQSDRFA